MADTIGSKQSRKFIWSHFFTAFRQGCRIWIDTLHSIHRTINDKISSERQDGLDQPLADNNFNSGSDSGNEQVPVIYGFRVIAKLCASIAMYIAWFVLDVQIGQKPSRGFVRSSYMMGAFSAIMGIIVADIMYASQVEKILPRRSGNIVILMSFVARATETSYALFGSFCLLYLVRYRRFLIDFLLYDCPWIRLNKSFQARVAARIFITSYLSSLAAEPLFNTLVLLENFKQPDMLADLPQNQFSVVKFFFTIFTAWGSSFLSAWERLFPTMTCFLICAISHYLTGVANKELTRFTGEIYAATPSKRKPKFDRIQLDKIYADYGVRTLGLDWPEINQQEASIDSDCSSFHKTPNKLNHHPLGQVEFHFNNSLFCYKNLIRTLREMKKLIEKYEKIFGSFHVWLISLQGVRLAQWLGVALVQISTIDNEITKEEAHGLVIFLYLPVCISVFVFILANTFMFHHCDSMADQMVKLRSQLFSNNLQVAHQNMEKISAQELASIWTLYDVLDGLSREVNFKFTPDTFYSKQCLLVVMSREISIILLYLQVIQIYQTR